MDEGEKGKVTEKADQVDVLEVEKTFQLVLVWHVETEQDVVQVLHPDPAFFSITLENLLKLLDFNHHKIPHLLIQNIETRSTVFREFKK